nr:endonuclease III [bacterium]
MQAQWQQEALKRLAALYPDAKPELEFVSPYQCMVSTVLAAQCTDKQVNKITPALFAKYPTPADMAAATVEELIPYVKSCGVYRLKAEHLVAACRRIMEVYGGQVPGNLEDLQTLPGVGRKTANVVYANAFGGDAIAVDTHVFRVSNRIGLAHAKDVLKTEQQLMEVIPKADWSAAHHWILLHGRRVCRAQRPSCQACVLYDICDYALAQRQQDDAAL